jgi:hypothetical protein
MVALVGVALCGCGVTQTMTRRNALAPLPAAPLALPATSGVGLTARFAGGTLDPQPTLGAVTFPYVQPELNGTVRLGHLSVGARASFVSAAFPAHDPGNGAPRVSRDQVAMEAVLGLGYEFTIGKHFGFVAAGDAGAIFASVAVQDPSGVIRQPAELDAVPSVALGTGPFFTWGPLRLYAGAVLGTLLGNHWTTGGAIDCTLTPCTQEMGMLLVGGGAVVRFSSAVTLGAELWTGWMEGTGIPLNASVTLRLGDLDFALPKKPRPAKKRAPSGPPPPAWEEPVQPPPP